MQTIDMVSEAKDFVEKHKITSGWTQEQHVGLVASTLIAALGIESVDDKKTIASIMAQTVNPSAFRQKLEKKGLLQAVKSEDKSETLANRYL